MVARSWSFLVPSPALKHDPNPGGDFRTRSAAPPVPHFAARRDNTGVRMHNHFFLKRGLNTGVALLLTLTVLLPFAFAGQPPEAGKKGILLVAFGTSEEKALPAYEGIEAAFRPALEPGEALVWAYTSNIIRTKLNRQGKKVHSVDEALDALAEQGVTDLSVQSLHIMAGEEFTKLDRLLQSNAIQHPGRFRTMRLGRPLVESMDDAQAVAKAALHAVPSARKSGDAVLFMAHGQDAGRCDMVFAGMNAVMNSIDPLAFMASVEGYQRIENIIPILKEKGVARVWIMPFMVVAGEHARNDLAGDEPDSWASLLRKEGLTVFPVLRGMGEIPGIQDVFARHAAESHDDIVNPKIKFTAE